MAVILGLAIAGCHRPEREPGAPIASTWESPPGNSAPPPVVAATAPAEPDATVVSPPIATVNGEPIFRAAFVDALIQAQGVNLLEKLIVSAAIQQRAAALNLTITDADVQVEYDDALRRIASPLTSFGYAAQRSGEFDRAAAEALLNEFLDAKNISRSEYMLRMRQKAYLRKIAEHEVKIDDVQLADEYERAYGEKVQVRCIQVSTPEAVRRVRAALDEGKDFELVARQMSENSFVAARGGLLPPFTRYDDVPKLLRDAAFALQVGQVSSTIHENNAFYVLRLEGRFPKSEVGVENVKEDLRRRVRDRLVLERMDALEAELFAGASIQILDPAMRDEFRRRYPATRVGASP